MYLNLYQYLIHNKTLSLPGLGLFTIESIPARTDIASKLIMPPFYSFRFQQESGSLSKRLFAWLAAKEGISELDAIRKINDLVFDIKSQLSAGKRVIWKGVGILTQGLAGKIEFEAEKKKLEFEHQVTAEKVVRDQYEQTVLVGDREKTVQVSERHTVSQDNLSSKRVDSKWWAFAIVIAFILIMILGWHFSEKGVSPAASGSSKKIDARESQKSYRTIQ